MSREATKRHDPLIACVDVDYRRSAAVAAGLWFRGWTAKVIEIKAVASFSHVGEYQPGAFYRRELPCLLGVLSQGPQPDITIVDGYVWLGEKTAGLGAHLHAAIGGVVIGVAKTEYVSARDAVPVYRGASRNPLFVSAVGIAIEQAIKGVVEMDGSFRIPTLLKMVDSLARCS